MGDGPNSSLDRARAGLAGARHAKSNAGHDVAWLCQFLEDQLAKSIRPLEKTMTGR